MLCYLMWPLLIGLAFCLVKPQPVLMIFFKLSINVYLRSLIGTHHLENCLGKNSDLFLNLGLHLA